MTVRLAALLEEHTELRDASIVRLIDLLVTPR
jgi:hypothetical protein